MKSKVGRLTQVLYEEGKGDVQETAKVFSNFVSQLAVQPFVAPTNKTPQHIFGENAIATLSKAKEKSQKPGGKCDMFRRNIIVAGAEGPLSPNSISLRGMARLTGYGSNHGRISSLTKAKKKSKSMEELLSHDAVAAKFKSRKDKLSGDPIWTEAWHHFMELKKGQSFRCKIVSKERVQDPVTKKWRWKTKWARHQKRFMSMKMSAFREAVLKWEPYLTWRREYLLRNPHLPSTWHVGEKRLYKEKCFCIDAQEAVRKCGCQYHLKMDQLIAGLKNWRRAVRSLIKELDPDHECETCSSFDEYLKPLTSLHNFGDAMCPCGRNENGDRYLKCSSGSCRECARPTDHLIECEREKDVKAQKDVTFKWLRPIKIGTRNEEEWAWDRMPYDEFKKLLASYYSDTYRLHNWVYKNQQHARLECRQRLQPGDVILEFDYAAKATQFQQDCMPCAAGKQTSHFVVFAHFNPISDEVGNNIRDTTEVFSFHSNCVTQDTHSIRRALTHVTENLKDRGFLKNTLHIWADGSGAQNKGRKSFRQWSELSFEQRVPIIANFAASCHFGGPWDTEGGRQARAVRNFLRNEHDKKKGESILDAGDNVKLLRHILKKAGEPDPPIASQKMWRPVPDSTESIECDESRVSATTGGSDERTAKPKRQARGRTAIEMEDDNTDPRYVIQRRHIWLMEPCECTRVCSCPSDGRLTYKRDVNYDCTVIEGTLSTYCYSFNKKPLHVDVRQYSCYCRWCSRRQFDKCVRIDVVRHRPEKPVLPSHEGYRKWRDQGWRSVVQVIKSAPDRAVTRVAQQSLESVKNYISKKSPGAVIAIMTVCDDNNSFWLASLQSKVFPAPKSDSNTGVKKGELVVKVIWFDKCDDHSLKYVRLDDLVTLSISSVVVTKSNITWQRTTTNRYYLGEHTHNTLVELVEQMSLV